MKLNNRVPVTETVNRREDFLKDVGVFKTDLSGVQAFITRGK